jgi:uncharacterized protein YjbI with pentapeptide repeats
MIVLLSVSVAKTAAGPDVDLAGRSQSGRDLRGANFRDADLTSRDFSNADLRGADITGAKLDRINLDGADLRGVIGWSKVVLGLGMSANDANFSGTDLRDAKIAGGYSGGYFERADFSNANLAGATLHGRFHGAKFSGAVLTGTLMLGADGLESQRDDLRRAGAIVTAEDFAAAIESGRDFSDSILRHAKLQGVRLTGAKLAGADLHSANLDDSQLDGADLRRVHLYFATAKGARFDRADLSGAKVNNMSAAGASFVGAKLVNTSLAGADLSGADLRNADFTGANLSSVDLTGANLTGAIIDGATVEAAIIEDVHGVPQETQRELKQRARRWQHELRIGIDDFLQEWSLLLHLTLTPFTAALGVIGFRGGRVQPFFAGLTGINLAAFIPLLIGQTFAVLGGSPTAQLSDPGLWTAWFHLWPALMVGLAAILVATLLIGAYQIVRYLIRAPRIRPILTLLCILLTVANCLFAGHVLLMMAPDA